MKDELGSGAWDPQGIAQVALRTLHDDFGTSWYSWPTSVSTSTRVTGTVVCLRTDGTVDNDATLELYGRVALAKPRPERQSSAPSGMMDGQVAAIRGALDGAGFDETIILAYAAKYASGLYDRSVMPWASRSSKAVTARGTSRTTATDVRPFVKRRADVEQGADMVMVKPAMSYLDVVSDLRRELDVPLCAYHVSGEYAMVKAAAAQGWIDGPAVALEQLTAVKRAGADFVLTYFARDLATELSR